MHKKNNMKIAVVKCSGSLNVGNEFINAGGLFLIRKLFPDAEIFEHEFFDSSIAFNYSHPTSVLLDWSKKQIENCDFMFVLSGCIISKYTNDVLTELSKIKVKKILLGAGAYQYDKFDEKLSKKSAKKFDYIFTRDEISFSFFDGAKNVFSGIDLAFFAKDAGYIDASKGNYALINLDLISDNQNSIEKEYSKLKKKYKKTYIIENTTTKYTDIKNFLYIGYWDNLYNTIAHAQYVVTNRIHTAVCCLCNAVPFIYHGYDCFENDVRGRHSLFQKFGFNLISNKVYNQSDLEQYQLQISKEKLNLISLIKKITSQNKR